jgi:hypothetical protein
MHTIYKYTIMYQSNTKNFIMFTVKSIVYYTINIVCLLRVSTNLVAILMDGQKCI